MVIEYVQAVRGAKYKARAALRNIILRGQIGRVASVVSRYGRGPRAMRQLRSVFKGLTVQARQHVMNFAFSATQAPVLQRGNRLFLKDIPIARGLGRHMVEGTRVWYGVDVTWTNTNTGEVKTMFMQQDYDAPQLNEILEQHMEDIARENINESPGSFGVAGEANIVINKVDIVYVMRAF